LECRCIAWLGNTSAFLHGFGCINRSLSFLSAHMKINFTCQGLSLNYSYACEANFVMAYVCVCLFFCWDKLGYAEQYCFTHQHDSSPSVHAHLDKSACMTHHPFTLHVKVVYCEFRPWWNQVCNVVLVVSRIPWNDCHSTWLYRFARKG
jgi:hypothetical protein